MQKKPPKISIVTVHYKSKEDLFTSVASIITSKPVTPYEIIVVDNDERKTIQDSLLHNFSTVRYIASPGNIGFGAGNNIGATKAVGKYFFFLNPDTVVYEGAIDKLVTYMESNEEIGIVAPLLIDKNGVPFIQQGSMELTPIIAIFALTFINKYFPNNPVSKRYFLRDWNKKTIRTVDVVPGSAFVVRKEVFEKVGGFDKNMFLFFEEEDLCKRVQNLGYKIFINPKAHVLHKWGRDKQETRAMKKIFTQSRFYYFRKHFGLLSAIIVHVVTTL